MRVAFYAPLKPSGHPTPSGDRAMARALIAALAHAEVQACQTSTLRTRDGAGNPVAQARLFAQARTEIARLIPEGRKQEWQAWVTYHNYYKAPDLIGPAVAAGLGIPYLLVEASRARKRLTGPWSAFAKAAEAASDAADVIFYLTHRDAETLEHDRPHRQRLIHLRPFLAREELPAMSSLNGPMLAVGMLREGDKLASYRVIAQTLASLTDINWQLDIAGEGPSRGTVAALMAPFGDRVRFLGLLNEAELSDVYARASLLFWPGVNEAFGLAYLEAQAAGLPVVAQDRPGVRDVLAPADHPPPDAGSAALAAALRDLLSDATLRAERGRRARAHVAAHHLLPAAAETLLDGLAACGVRS